MTDSLRPEVGPALELCASAGIKTIIITGDHQETATAIAKELDLWQEGDLVVTGAELDAMSRDELEKKIESIRVYARTTAEHKLRIVTTLKNRGHIVAVTGDGVNDAPAIKAADIGIAMGITGTEVTKQASDMVITDDNFASMVSAVCEGRGIHDNLVKFISYLVSANLAELLIVFWGTIGQIRSIQGTPAIPLIPIHLLWINLITDGLPAVALGVDPIDQSVMKRMPRNKNAPLFSKNSIAELVAMGMIIAGGGLVAFHVGLGSSIAHGYTMTLTTFVILEFVRAQLIRSQFKTPLFSNGWLTLAISISLILHLCIVYHPHLQPIFKTAPLAPHEWGIIFVIALAVWLLGKSLSFVTQKR
jgi:Ca2+-transporting ATPase